MGQPWGTAMVKYEQKTDLNDFDEYDVALVCLKADGSADVRVNVLGSTEGLENFRNLEKALRYANTRASDAIDKVSKVMVYLHEGAAWDYDLGALTPEKPSSLTAIRMR